MKFNELDNGELIFTHFIIQDILDGFNEVIEDKGVTQVLDSNVGTVELFKKYTDEEVDKIKNGAKLKILKSISQKLAPIIDIIEDSDPKLVGEIRNVFDKSSLDDSEEEDL